MLDNQLCFVNAFVQLIEACLQAIHKRFNIFFGVEFGSVNPNTNLSNLQATKTQTIKTICEIMEATVGANMQELKLEAIGQILNILKEIVHNLVENHVFKGVAVDVHFFKLIERC